MKSKMNVALCVVAVVAIMAAAATADVIYDLPATQANYTMQSAPDTVQDGSVELKLFKSPDSSVRAIPHIDFDLSSLDGLTSEDIVSATLKFRGYYGLSPSLNTHLWYCTEAWDATTLTWNNTPTSADTGIDLSPTASGEGYNNNVDITSVVKNWVDGTWPSCGIRFFYGGDSAYHITKISGMDNEDGYAPMIEVVAVPEPATLTLIGMGGLALLRRRSR